MVAVTICSAAGCLKAELVRFPLAYGVAELASSTSSTSSAYKILILKGISENILGI